MKTSLLRVLAVVSLLAVATGCAWQVGSSPKHITTEPTVGQQLIDLQKAKEAGAITDQEYQTEKTKILAK